MSSPWDDHDRDSLAAIRERHSTSPLGRGPGWAASDREGEDNDGPGLESRRTRLLRDPRARARARKLGCAVGLLGDSELEEVCRGK